jgi:hypothetical protein
MNFECDSIHARIKRKSRNILVYDTKGWAQTTKTSKNFPWSGLMLIFKYLRSQCKMFAGFAMRKMNLLRSTM